MQTQPWARPLTSSPCTGRPCCRAAALPAARLLVGTRETWQGSGCGVCGSDALHGFYCIVCLPRRPSRSVVLSVRGSNSMEDLLTDMMDRPLDITAWLPEGLRQASGGWPRLVGLEASGACQALAAPAGQPDRKAASLADCFDPAVAACIIGCRSIPTARRGCRRTWACLVQPKRCCRWAFCPMCMAAAAGHAGHAGLSLVCQLTAHRDHARIGIAPV